MSNWMHTVSIRCISDGNIDVYMNAPYRVPMTSSGISSGNDEISFILFISCMGIQQIACNEPAR